MARKVIFGLILGLFICNATALQCLTCSGENCNNIDAPMVECSLRVPRLPFDYKSPDINLDDAEYVCLDLEYVEGQQRIPVHQCYLTTLSGDPCEDIKLRLTGGKELKNCKIKRVDAEPPITGTSTTETPTTENPTTKPPPTEQPTTETHPTEEPTTETPTTETPPTEEPSPQTPSETPPTEEPSPQTPSETPPTEESSPQTPSETPPTEESSPPTPSKTPPTEEPPPETPPPEISSTETPPSETSPPEISSTEAPPPETPPPETPPPEISSTESPPTETSTLSTTTAGAMSATVAAMLLIGVTFVINVVV